MELKVEKERLTPLLARKRVTAHLSFQGKTPSRKELRDVIAQKLKAEKDLTIIKHIYTKFGSQDARVIAHVYSSPAELNRIEHKQLVKKHAEAPAEDKKA
ncbi:30S ribosomal protein S24e [Candidatus Woesearchaeota archaeon]|nr:30S ribosomal protein S24e [Candidatus Woesearchaeota archaeon]